MKNEDKKLQHRGTENTEERQKTATTDYAGLRGFDFICNQGESNNC